MGSMCVFCLYSENETRRKKKKKIRGLSTPPTPQKTLLWSGADISKNLIYRGVLALFAVAVHSFKSTTFCCSPKLTLCLFVFKSLIYIFAGCCLTSC